MASQPEAKKRVGRRLTKKRQLNRASSVQYPDRLREGEDAQEDVTATAGKPSQYMNQSIFSMITAAGSTVDFNARFEEDSSDSDYEREQRAHGQGLASFTGNHGDRSAKSLGKQIPEKQREKSAERRGVRLPKLNLRTIKEKNYMSQSSLLDSAGLTPHESPIGVTPRNAPVMSRMLEAQADSGQSSTSPTEKQQDKELQSASGGGNDQPASLSLRLKDIFAFEQAEEVISEYPCWLLQSVLLQGYMYITRGHVSFYAYLPKKSNVVAKSGSLSKRGKQNPRFSRYWFTLKGDVLSYFADQSDRYFPSGNIDLRYGISASLTPQKEKGKDVKDFSIVTNQRVYFFKADSAESAKEWVKTLRKVIFRSHNDGDSIKISLPIENIIDVEENPVVDFAETLKIRVVESEETYVIDEYFFSFFSFGKDALDVLRSLVDGSTAQQISDSLLVPTSANDDCRSRESSRVRSARKHSPLERGTPVLREQVRATLVPVVAGESGRPSPRPSGEWSRSSLDVGRNGMDASARDFSRASFDRGRRSASVSRTRAGQKPVETEAPSPTAQDSTYSIFQPLEQGTYSPEPCVSSNGTQTSGSQILQRSDLFQSPMLQRLHSSQRIVKGKGRRKSEDSPRIDSVPAQIEIRPPTRSHTAQSTYSGQDTVDQNKQHLSHSNSSPALQQIVKAGAYPLQRATKLAGYLHSRSKRMSNLLAAESMGYVEKVSGMWAGGRKHYGEDEVIIPEDRLEDPNEEDIGAGHGDRFRAHFALPPTEKLLATYFGFLHRVLPLYGKIYISNRKFCFRSLVPGAKTKLVLPLKDVENVDKEKGFRFRFSGLVIVIRGHEELFFEFDNQEVRDDCAVTLLENLETIRDLQQSGLLTREDKEEAQLAQAEHIMLQEARRVDCNGHELRLPESADDPLHPQEAPSILFDDPRASILNFKPTESLRVTCLTIGSRGDVQPYIALCKGLLAEGHKPKIATHAEFESWIRKHGIDFAPVDGNPAELMRICVENGMFTYSFLREASLKFRGWIDELLTSAWKACQRTDILIESPSAMAGIHIAEALGVPYFRAFTMPWTRTRAYPHAFAVPEHKMGGSYNYFTYLMFDNVFWKAIAGQINRWRKKELGLRSTNLEKLQPNKVPFLYNFSPCVVVPPLDYSDWIRVTGYWFLDEASDWTPPLEITEFIAQARADEKAVVYIGFGSIVVSDPAALTKTVVDSVLKADVRCILSKGWSDRLGNHDAAVPEIPLPSEILQIKSAPHDWLFRQIDAAVHHGGAGTTGASLRAGLPTIVKPFFGDQFFFGSRVEDLGVGICMKKLNVSVFSRALWEATHSHRMIVKAKILGEQIRKEDGVATAIKAIYRDLEYAKSLIKNRAHVANDDTYDEESWTFIGDESDPELARRIAEYPWQTSGRMLQGKGLGIEPRASIDLGA